MDRPFVADYPAGARMPPRVIDDYEFVWMLRGRATFVLDGAEVSLGQGRLLLVPPGLRHGFGWDPDRPSSHGYVHFRPEDVGVPPPADFRLVRMGAADPLPGLCAYLLRLGGRDRWRATARAVLDLMLTLVTTGPLPNSADPWPSAGLAPTVEFLRRAWAQPPLRRIDVDELATASALSRGYLTRLFRAEFGLAPATALTHLRCVRAEVLLLRTDLTVEVIAAHCGFADLSHFSHRFAALYGLSPRAYRATGTGHPSLLQDAGTRRLAHLVWET
ncbi:helix-turn-helix domain-containing protein [Streptomyces sp. NPDC001698]|uniref:helix-turn-helix domain-containing protein n=1 Tax=unclassified Streptomyces TaxID=2593676 RepID=UPI0036989A43